MTIEFKVGQIWTNRVVSYRITRIVDCVPYSTHSGMVVKEAYAVSIRPSYDDAGLVVGDWAFGMIHSDGLARKENYCGFHLVDNE